MSLIAKIILMLSVSLSSTGEILPLCETEDQNGCMWIAELQGNGQGDSFIALEDGTLFYFYR